VGLVAELLLGFGPTILFLLLLFWFMRRSRGSMLGGFGRSKARSTHRRSRDHLRDVAGSTRRSRN